MKPWSDLPNAAHIDRVLTHLREHPECWGAARDTARDAAWDAVRDTAWDAARDAAWGVAGGALAALVAWDDCADLLCLPPDVLRARINLVGNDHAAVLLLPAAIAMQGSNTE